MSDYISKFEIIWNSDHARYYTNVRPLAEIMPDGRLENVDEREFGQYGSVSITDASDTARTQHPFVRDQRFFIFSVDDARMEEFRNYPTPRMRLGDLLPRAVPIDSTSYRELVVLGDGYSPRSFRAWGGSQIAGCTAPVTKEVYLESEGRVFGPFLWDSFGEDVLRFFPIGMAGDRYSAASYQKDGIRSYSFEAGKHRRDRLTGKIKNLIKINELPKDHEQIDCIDDKALKEQMIVLISRSSESRGDKRSLREAVMELPSEEITEERRGRMLELVRNGELADQTLRQMSSVLTEDQASLDTIVRTILGNVDYARRLAPMILGSEDLRRELQRAGGIQIGADAERTRAAENGVQSEERAGAQRTVGPISWAAMKAETQALRDRIAQLEEEAAPLEERGRIVREIEELKAEQSGLEAHYSSMMALRETLEQEIRTRIRSAYTGTMFDGAVSSIVMQEAAEFEREHRRAKERLARQKRRDDAPSPEIDESLAQPRALAEHIHRELTMRGGRDISLSDVANILISISTGFLTVFAGAPGTGKTSLVSMLASILGLRGPSQRFAEIAVEKGWTSRRDLIGYWNPLTRSFDAANRGMYGALCTLDEEARAGVERVPYFVLLDEANLSQMEHYWADFMSLCDFEKPDRTVSLSDENEFRIPQTLRFLATINLDHTTETLSPRLIDRAWVIRLKAPDIGIGEYVSPAVETDYPRVPFDAMRALACASRDRMYRMDPAVAERFDRIRIQFRDAGSPLSPRVIGMVRSYCAAAELLMSDGENSYAALDYAVSQKVLPMLDGFGAKYGLFLDELARECSDGSMPLCSELIKTMRSKGEDNMQYYSFFSR